MAFYPNHKPASSTGNHTHKVANSQWRFGTSRFNLIIERADISRNLLLCGVLATCGMLSLSVGTMTVSPQTVLTALLGQGDAMTRFLIFDLRLNRLLAGIFTGAAFSLAGCLMQTVARNRLATPGIIGLDNAAMAFAVASVTGVGFGLAPSAMALTGAATATALAFAVGGGSGTRGYRFIVAGLAIGAVSGAVSQLLLAQVHIDTANAAYPWTVGTLSGRPAEQIPLTGLITVAALFLCITLTRYFRLMAFSDPVIITLGHTPNRLRLCSVLIAVTLTGFAVAYAGPVGMIALAGPEMARSFARHRGLPVVSCALSGAILMVLADLAGRTLLSPIELPVGIVTAVTGGPYLIWILIRQPQRSTL